MLFPERLHCALSCTLSDEKSRALYDGSALPGPGRSHVALGQPGREGVAAYALA
jgi:hypothetical protein